MKSRLNKVYQRLKREKIDALLLNKEENISYLSGFQGSSAWALISGGKSNFLITDPRYAEAASKEAPGFKVKLRNGSVYSVLNDLCRKLGVKRLGFEAGWLSYSDYVKLRSKLGLVQLSPTLDIVEAIREVKEAGEIKLLEKAVQISDKAHQELPRLIRSGMSEKELAGEIDHILRIYGAEASSFPTIVTSDERTSLPHGRPTAKKLGPSGPVMVDFGASYKGYKSDLTRMVFLGRMSRKFKKIYGWLLFAQAKAIGKVRPGVKISDVDRAARQYLGSKGLAKYFLHGLGHGIGREIHESPQLSQATSTRLKEGMVFTVEPALYIPGWGGLRIEDVVLVTRAGKKVLSGAPRGIINIK